MSDTSDRINRSSGDFVGGYNVGGGYRGKRDDQDDAVRTFARRLAHVFPGHGIEIRYNTDRLGGGAWLKDGHGDAQVGLGAELKPPEWHKEQWRAYLGDRRDEKPVSVKTVDPDELNLVHTVHLVVPAVEPEHADKTSSLGGRPDYTHRAFDNRDRDGAWSWFVEHVQLDGVNPPPE